MISATHLHAMAVHFPIALLFISFFSELVYLITKRKFFAQAALYLLLCGAAGTLIAYFSGHEAGEGMEEGTLAAATELHEQSAVIALVLTIVTAAAFSFRHLRKMETALVKTLCILLFTTTIIFIARTGYLGGQLVYKHGAGVELGLPDFSNPDSD